MTIKLLAVDDSNTMRKVLGITFVTDGFQTTICKSGAEAVQAAQGGAPQVALVDAHLAGESGYDVCRQIRSASPSTVVLMMTSKQRPYDEAAGASAGAAGNFDKPFDSQKFIDKVLSLAGAPAQPSPATMAPSAAMAAPRPQVSVPAAAPQVAVAKAPEPAAAPKPTVSLGPKPVAAAPSPAVSVPAAGAQRPAMSQPAPVAAPAAARPAAAAPVAAKPADARLDGELGPKLADLGLTQAQVAAVLALSREVVEQVVWEVVPALAETMIKEEIRRLTAAE